MMAFPPEMGRIIADCLLTTQSAIISFAGVPFGDNDPVFTPLYV